MSSLIIPCIARSSIIKSIPCKYGKTLYSHSFNSSTAINSLLLTKSFSRQFANSPQPQPQQSNNNFAESSHFVDVTNSIYKLASSSSSNWETVKQVYSDLIDQASKSRELPDIHTYNSLLLQAAKESNFNKASQQVDFICKEMVSHGIIVHPSTLTLLINIATMHSQFAKAKQLILSATNQDNPSNNTDTNNGSTSSLLIYPNQYTLAVIQNPYELLFSNMDLLNSIHEKTRNDTHTPQYYTQKCIELLDKYIANPPKRAKSAKSNAKDNPKKSKYDLSELIELVSKDDFSSRFTIQELKEIQTLPELMNQPKAISSRTKPAHVQVVENWLRNKRDNINNNTSNNKS